MNGRLCTWRGAVSSYLKEQDEPQDCSQGVIRRNLLPESLVTVTVGGGNHGVGPVTSLGDFG